MNFRMLSNTLFGLAIGCATLLKAFAVSDALVWLAVGSVAGAMILTNMMIIRSVGLAGVSGLSWVYMNLSGRSIPGTAIIAVVTTLLAFAVLLAIYSDLSDSSKGKIKSDET
jgi:hypothetical protein